MKVKAQLPINLTASLQTTRWKAILDQTIKQGNELVDKVDTLIQNQSSTVPSGTIVMFAGSSAPSGWLLCDGSVLSRVDYTNLFNSIGITYNTGGETGAQFRLPNTQGVFVRGVGQQTISAQNFPPSAATLGQKSPDATAVNGLTATDSGHTHPGANVINGTYAGAVIRPVVSGTTTGTGFANITVNSTDAETTPAFIALNYIIKT